MRYTLNTLKSFFHFVYPSGKPMPPHLLRCQGLAVDDYSFALERLEAGTPSTFAQLGLKRPLVFLVARANRRRCSVVGLPEVIVQMLCGKSPAPAKLGA
jgi:hypothetical protein